MNDRLVSVIVPVFNGERYVAEAIESVLAQTYPDIELIVVDDGSTDRSAEIVAGYDGVRLLRQTNAGPVAARLHGLSRSSGVFVTFLDHDDVFFPHRVERQVAYLDEHPEVAAVLCRHEILLEEGMTLPTWVKPDPVYGDPNGVEPTSMLARRAALDSPGCFDTAFRFADGMRMLSRMRATGLVIEVCAEKLWHRRIHATNDSRDRAKVRSGLLHLLKDKVDRERAGHG
jgi:glycosyltransferase involved in cell wall biosynthesis